MMECVVAIFVGKNGSAHAAVNGEIGQATSVKIVIDVSVANVFTMIWDAA
jgi:hypothetical protein